MADNTSNPPYFSSSSPPSTQNQELTFEEYKNHITSTIPIVSDFPVPVHSCNGFNVVANHLAGVMFAQRHFRAKSNDILLATMPKSGTTWLKAILFAVVNRHTFPPSHPNHPLLTENPHNLVPFVELNLDKDENNDITSPRSCQLLATHIPYRILAESFDVIKSGCQIVYLCRNPKDTFVSLWNFTNMGIPGAKQLSLETGFELFCNGVLAFGPYWEHVLEYWKASLERPDKVLFVKYEELMRDTVGELKKVAEFVGCGFTEDEVDSGEVIEGIVRLCGFERLKSLEANREGGKVELMGQWTFESRSFFRKGVVGDWMNFLSLEMSSKLDEITESKFAGSGLYF